MQLFYAPNINSGDFFLNEKESHHCVNVLRNKQNDIINLIDGNGGFYTVEIIDASSKKCTFKIKESIKNEKENKYKIHLAVAPTKNTERFEWLVEKLTEVGIDEITPVFCEFSERKVLKTQRLEKVILSAVKQSLKFYLPKLNKPVNFKELININFEGQKFIAHCKEHALALKEQYQQKNNVLIFIGPEGDFSDEEIKLALSNNFIPVSLGKSRLRTETAALVACHTINLLNQ
ncbi:MAG: 16S rRNA (uracil(1498)-N(3))-methyltransferase [Bacteroidales bacterium]|nr:16S rRNA (uracil(1498)-N(3))-methyltransferase [Bacteroidales bacterium]